MRKGTPAEGARSRLWNAGCSYMKWGKAALLRTLAGGLLRRPWSLGAWLMLLGLAIPRRWSYPILWRLAYWLHVPGISPAWRFRDGRKIAEPPADIVAVILTVGEQTLEECLASVRRQSMPARRVEIIENVAPLSEACNRMLEVADGEFHVLVDADMILDRHCFRRMVRMLRYDENTFCALAMLRDDVLGTIPHVKMFRTALTKGVRYEDVPGSDNVFHWALVNRGYDAVYTQATLGRHVSLQSPEMTYQTFRRRGQKAFLERPEEVGSLVRRLARVYAKRGDADCLLALVAFCHGLFGEETGEKDARRYEEGDVRKAIKVLDSARADRSGEPAADEGG